MAEYSSSDTEDETNLDLDYLDCIYLKSRTDISEKDNPFTPQDDKFHVRFCLRKSTVLRLLSEISKICTL